MVQPKTFFFSVIIFCNALFVVLHNNEFK